MDLGNGAIGKAVERNSKVKPLTIDKIAEVFPEHLVALGIEKPTHSGNIQEPEGEDYDIRPGKQKEVIPLGKHVPLRLSADEYGEAFGDWKGLPMYNEPITASFVQTYRDTKVHPVQYYLHDPRFRDCTFGAIITGDSMHSEIRHGDYVACKEIHDWSFISYGDIYYVVAKNGLETCKYVQRMKLGIKPEAQKRGTTRGRYDELDIIYDETKVLLVPYNNSIDPSPLPIDMIERLYKVRGIVRGY